MTGAMPFLHRWWGNPMFSAMARRWFGAESIHDVYCGLRGFTKDFYNRLNQRCTGMEFATEMIIKASLFREKMSEVPITLHADGRRSHAPHLKTFRDGWRTLRFFLMFSPRWLFVVPGALLILLGLIGYGLAMPRTELGGVTFDAHTLLFASLAILCGYQSILFALFTKTFAIGEGLMPEDPYLTRFFRLVITRAWTLDCCRGPADGFGAFTRSNESVANGKLWTPGLRRDHATRSAGSNADSPRLPNHPVELFRQHTWDAPAMKDNPSSTTEFDKYAVDYDRLSPRDSLFQERTSITSHRVGLHGWRVAYGAS